MPKTREYRLTNTGCIYEYVRAESDDDAIWQAGEIANRDDIALNVLDDTGTVVATVIPGRGF